MGVYLCMETVSVVRLRGWGRTAGDVGESGFRIEFRDPGEFAVSWRPVLRKQLLLSVSIEHLTLMVGTEQVTSGGGWVGYGREFRGALAGDFQAQVLNALTTRTGEQTWLGAYATWPNGTRRDAVFQIHDLDESELRDRLAAAIPAWADGYVESARMATWAQPIRSREELAEVYARVDRMREQRLLDDRQALALTSEAAGPMINSAIETLRSPGVSAGQIEPIRREIEHLYHTARITGEQARQVEEQLAWSSPQAQGSERARQLQALGELREIGALGEAEFQAERTRLLGLPRSP